MTLKIIASKPLKNVPVKNLGK